MKRLLKIILILLGVIILIVGSEFVYSRNNPSLVIYLSVEMGKYYAEKGDITKSIKALYFGANYAIDINKKEYSSIIPKNFRIDSNPPTLNNSLKTKIKSYLTHLDYVELSKSNSYNFSRVYYDLGILAYQNGNSDLFPNLIEISYYLDPTLSYWPIELSNYYFYIDQKDKALEILERCQKNLFPKKECKEYETFLTTDKKANTPGFLLDETEKFYKTKSILSNIFPQSLNLNHKVFNTF